MIKFRNEQVLQREHPEALNKINSGKSPYGGDKTPNDHQKEESPKSNEPQPVDQLSPSEPQELKRQEDVSLDEALFNADSKALEQDDEKDTADLADADDYDIKDDDKEPFEQNTEDGQDKKFGYENSNDSNKPNCDNSSDQNKGEADMGQNNNAPKMISPLQPVAVRAQRVQVIMLKFTQ